MHTTPEHILVLGEVVLLIGLVSSCLARVCDPSTWKSSQVLAPINNAKVKASANFYIIDYAEAFTFRYISGCLSFSIRLISSLSFLFASTEKNKLNISEFYKVI